MNFTFTSIEGERFNLTVPSSELNTGPFEDDTSMCQTLVNAYSGSDFVPGENLLKYYYSMWDVDNQKLGFSPSSKLAQCIQNASLSLICGVISHRKMNNDYAISLRG